MIFHPVKIPGIKQAAVGVVVAVVNVAAANTFDLVKTVARQLVVVVVGCAFGLSTFDLVVDIGDLRTFLARLDQCVVCFLKVLVSNLVLQLIGWLVAGHFRLDLTINKIFISIKNILSNNSYFFEQGCKIYDFLQYSKCK